MIWLIGLVVVAVGLAIAGLVTDPKGKWVTIRDYEDMGDYLKTGCPFVEFSRQLAWWAGIRDKGRNDFMGYAGAAALLFGIFWCLLHPSVPGPWFFWLLWLPIITLEGYGPMNGVGEKLYGELWKK